MPKNISEAQLKELNKIREELEQAYHKHMQAQNLWQLGTFLFVGLAAASVKVLVDSVKISS